MAPPHQPRDPYPGEGTDSSPLAYESYDQEPARVRVVLWDVVFTVAIWAALFIVATATSWPSWLFGFVANVCPADSCLPVPFGIDLWIYPTVWAGIGAAVAAAVIGPCVSLVKGWYMFFWPILAIAIVILSSMAGSAMTAFSQHYWH